MAGTVAQRLGCTLQPLRKSIVIPPPPFLNFPAATILQFRAASRSLPASSPGATISDAHWVRAPPGFSGKIEIIPLQSTFPFDVH